MIYETIIRWQDFLIGIGLLLAGFFILCGIVKWPYQEDWSFFKKLRHTLRESTKEGIKEIIKCFNGHNETKISKQRIEKLVKEHKHSFQVSFAFKFLPLFLEEYSNSLLRLDDLTNFNMWILKYQKYFPEEIVIREILPEAQVTDVNGSKNIKVLLIKYQTDQIPGAPIFSSIVLELKSRRTWHFTAEVSVFGNLMLCGVDKNIHSVYHVLKNAEDFAIEPLRIVREILETEQKETSEKDAKFDEGIDYDALSDEELKKVDIQRWRARNAERCLKDLQEKEALHKEQEETQETDSSKKTDVFIVEKTPLMVFVQGKKLQIGDFKNLDNGELFKSCIFTDLNTGERTFVAFSKLL